MIYFTSDTHFNHYNINNLRGFPSVYVMNRHIIDVHNNVVTENDYVFHCGDVLWAKNLSDYDLYFKQVKFKKMFICLGNHDEKLEKYLRKNNIKNVFLIARCIDIKVNGVKIKLFHYPIEDWESKHRGSIHIHGHEHLTSPYRIIENRINANVEFNNYKPISVNEVFIKCDRTKNLIDEKYKFNPGKLESYAINR